MFAFNGAFSYGLLMSLMLLLKQDDGINQMLSDDKSEDPGESTLLSDLIEDDSDYRQEVLLLGLARWDKSLPTTRIPLQKTQSRSDTVSVRSPLPNSRNPAWAMAPPLLKCLKSTVLNKSSEPDRAPST
jgi:hypothetical protein